MNFRLVALLIVTLGQVFGAIPAVAQVPATANSPVKSSSSETAPSTLSNDQIRELIRQAAEKDVANDKAQRDYTYIQRVEEHKLNGKGNLESTELRTFEVMMLYDEQVRKLVAKNDQPLVCQGSSQGRRKDPEADRQTQERERRRPPEAA